MKPSVILFDQPFKTALSRGASMGPKNACKNDAIHYCQNSF